MPIRFRRSVKLAPGLRLNFSGSGVSLTAGPRGASFNFGRRGSYFNAGIPGTGFYSRTRLDKPASSYARPTTDDLPEGMRGAIRPTGNPRYAMVTLRIELEDDGTFRFMIGSEPAPESVINKAKREHSREIRNMVSEVCDKLNAPAKALIELYRETPAPDARVKFVRRDFDEAIPKAPVAKAHGIAGWLFKSIAKKIDAENDVATKAYEANLADWRGRKAAFEQAEDQRERFLEELVFNDPDAMEQHFEHALQDIEWPRETKTSFEILEGGTDIAIDVDLPEIEDMPKKTWNLPARGINPVIKEHAEGEQLKIYSQHVQAVGFRIIGEAFALLPAIANVTLSAYTQRPDPKTGVQRDEYVYSVRVTRQSWSRINFQNLTAVDVGEAFASFELRRDSHRNGKLKPIEPFAVAGHATAEPLAPAT